MTAERVRNQLKRQPFLPFDVYTASGQKLHVPQPDLAWIPPSGRDLVVAAQNESVAILS